MTAHSHSVAMSFMQPNMLRSAVLATIRSGQSGAPKAAARFSAASSRPSSLGDQVASVARVSSPRVGLEDREQRALMCQQQALAAVEPGVPRPARAAFADSSRTARCWRRVLPTIGWRIADGPAGVPLFPAPCFASEPARTADREAEK